MDNWIVTLLASLGSGLIGFIIGWLLRGMPSDDFEMWDGRGMSDDDAAAHLKDQIEEWGRMSRDKKDRY